MDFFSLFFKTTKSSYRIQNLTCYQKKLGTHNGESFSSIDPNPTYLTSRKSTVKKILPKKWNFISLKKCVNWEIWAKLKQICQWQCHLQNQQFIIITTFIHLLSNVKPNEVYFLSGCCSQIKYDHPPTVFQRKSIVVVLVVCCDTRKK